MKIFLNTRLVPSQKAVVSVYDRGFLYGDGVFETFRAYAGVIFRLDQHLSRLEQSASLIDLKLPTHRAGFREILYRTLKANRLKDATLRLSVSRGTGELGLDPDRCTRGTVVVIPRAFKGYPKSLYQRGMRTAIVSTRRLGPEALDPRIKSSNFLNNILAAIEAKKAGADEGIMLNRNGHLTEGTVSNLFFVSQGRLFTPSSDAGLLKGITRQIILELAQSLDIPTQEGLFTPDYLKQSHECFITNTSMEVMPVTQMDRRPIGEGRPGTLTLMLKKAYTALVRQECQRKRMDEV